MAYKNRGNLSTLKGVLEGCSEKEREDQVEEEAATKSFQHNRR